MDTLTKVGSVLLFVSLLYVTAASLADDDRDTLPVPRVEDVDAIHLFGIGFDKIPPGATPDGIRKAPTIVLNARRDVNPYLLKALLN